MTIYQQYWKPMHATDCTYNISLDLAFNGVSLVVTTLCIYIYCCKINWWFQKRCINLESRCINISLNKTKCISSWTVLIRSNIYSHKNIFHGKFRLETLNNLKKLIDLPSLMQIRDQSHLLSETYKWLRFSRKYCVINLVNTTNFRNIVIKFNKV